ncbi:MAG: hypothetical protein V5A43_05390 [Haloarculaceae archaeon]
MAGSTLLRRGAGWFAGRGVLPGSMRALLGYYARTGVFDHRSLRLKRRVDATVDTFVQEAFTEVEREIAEELDREISFSYDTKLVLPAKLSLGYLYRRHPGSEHDRAESATRLIVEALIDGDMRDAINDDEYEDFVLGFEADRATVETAATVAQRVLQKRVEEGFAALPSEARSAYDRAVERSERHQETDPHFRELMTAAKKGKRGAREQIRGEYREARFEEPPELFTATDLDIPYLKTQFDRVGVIYSGMTEMYRSVDLAVERAFERSIVLAIIGAQIWLDDVDDFRADWRANQLTPVTAEYLLQGGPEARQTVVAVTDRYLGRARAQARAAESTLTGIAIEYIHERGTPSALPTGRP